MLGREPDASAGRLVVSPRLPIWLPSLELANLEVGGSVLRLRFWREPSGETRWEVLDRRGSLEVVERPASPSEL
jgi:hypothetical protein